MHVQESNLFFTALEKVCEYATQAGVLPTLVSENVRGIRFRTKDGTGQWRHPFLREELESLRAAGYRELGWRDVNTGDFGVPNMKPHVVLVAHAGLGSIVAHCLFSSVRII